MGCLSAVDTNLVNITVLVFLVGQTPSSRIHEHGLHSLQDTANTEVGNTGANRNVSSYSSREARAGLPTFRLHFINCRSKTLIRHSCADGTGIPPPPLFKLCTGYAERV